MATIKQKKAVDRIIENRGNISKSMVEAGYTKATAKNPSNLTKSDGFQELMEEFLPDTLLTEKHRELLTVPKKIRHFKKGDLESEYEELDSQAITKGLDMAYKLKGKYAPTKSIQLKVERKVIDPEILESEQQYNDLIKRKLIERSKVRDETDS